MSTPPPDLPGRVMQLLAAYMSKDADRCAQIASEINDQHGAQGLFATCCGLAGGFVAATGMRADSENMIGLENPDGAPEDDPELWAARFLVAFGNDDTETAVALFNTRMATEAFFAAGFTALLQIVTSAVRSQR